DFVTGGIRRFSASLRPVRLRPQIACPGRAVLVSYASSHGTPPSATAPPPRRTTPMPNANPMNPMGALQSMMRGISPGVLAFIGAMFAATHTSANETYLVVSINGTTNVVERIGFPVGDIKDIIPAGDKYIIHADPIDSLKDSVAVDALFVMEKDNPNAAFGRTFSKPIHSVAYVPGLDIAVWSYGNSTSTNLVEVQTGEGALKTAGSVSCFIPANAGFRFALAREAGKARGAWEGGWTQG
ncbi:MAG: hypothetical protein IKT16_06030, partial [Desulfovibrio sp.]|nr:hypothetical protein [Desulfovibrio sp.]